MNTKIKRTYKKPILDTHSIDTDISLVMMTSETEIPGDPVRSSVSTESTSTGKTSTLQETNFDQNPFEEMQ